MGGRHQAGRVWEDRAGDKEDIENRDVLVYPQTQPTQYYPFRKAKDIPPVAQ